MSEFFRYIRKETENIPTGYQENGMRLYRHLVYIGVEQMLESEYPQLKTELGAEQWTLLLDSFIRESQWSSHFYGDLCNEFILFLQQKST